MRCHIQDVRNCADVAMSSTVPKTVALHSVCLRPRQFCGTAVFVRSLKNIAVADLCRSYRSQTIFPLFSQHFRGVAG